ncbi:hypothetical protein C2E23DRAFT_803890 [Lenzites betulinus]|nr:hypothetical protein C2E23DRAFT_803890 [Lenzites betulinus]
MRPAYRVRCADTVPTAYTSRGTSLRPPPPPQRDAVRVPSGPARVQMRVTPGTRRTRGEPSLAAECWLGVGRCGRRRAVPCPARGRSRLPDEVWHDDGVGMYRKSTDRSFWDGVGMLCGPLPVVGIVLRLRECVSQ